jgi:hypothetical protein
VIHRRESGRIAWSATIRYAIALLVPFWDGDAPGRAYTRRERSRLRADETDSFAHRKTYDGPVVDSVSCEFIREAELPK